MHDSALHLPRSDSWPRLPVAIGGAARLDVLLFSGAAAVVALHALVDAFVAPEPGTGAPRPPAAGPCLRSFCSRWPLSRIRGCPPGDARLSPPSSASSASKERGSQSQMRGRSALGARTGPVSCSRRSASCCSLSRAVLLWRSRKPGRFRYLRRGAIALMTVIVAYCSSRRSRSGSSRRIARERPSSPPISGGPYEEVTLRTSDGLTSRPGTSPRATAQPSSRIRPARGSSPQARMLVRHGYGVLLLDARGYDGSDGDPNLFGWSGAKDIDAAVAWLQRRPDVKGGRIGGIGFSVGGEVLLQAAASNTGLRAVVSEGAGARSVREAPPPRAAGLARAPRRRHSRQQPWRS